MREADDGAPRPPKFRCASQCTQPADSINAIYAPSYRPLGKGFDRSTATFGLHDEIYFEVSLVSPWVGISALGTAQPPINPWLRRRVMLSRSNHLDFSPPSIHFSSVAAWICEFEPRARTCPYPSLLRPRKRQQPTCYESLHPPKEDTPYCARRIGGERLEHIHGFAQEQNVSCSLKSV